MSRPFRRFAALDDLVQRAGDDAGISNFGVSNLPRLMDFLVGDADVGDRSLINFRFGI